MSKPQRSYDADVRFLWNSFKTAIKYDGVNAENQRGIRLCWFTGFSTAANLAGDIALGKATERLFREVHGAGRQQGN